MDGLLLGLKEESKLKWQVIGGLLFPVLVLLTVSSWELASKSLAYATVLVTAELLNSAIERICDMIDTKPNSKIKKIKDLSAAAVMVVLIIFPALLLIEFTILLIKNF